MASKVARSGAQGAGGPSERLSKRELQVFEMIGFGSATMEIAAGLRIEGSTVGSYRARIKRKLNLRDASELLQSAIRWNLGRVGGPARAGRSAMNCWGDGAAWGLRIECRKPAKPEGIAQAFSSPVHSSARTWSP